MIEPHAGMPWSEKTVSKPLSELEVLALAALARLGPDAYGVLIRQEIEDRTDRSISIGSLYKALHRLEKRQFISSQLGEPTAVRGGRAKKYIRLEPQGRDALEASIRAVYGMVSGLDIGWDPG